MSFLKKLFSARGPEDYLKKGDTLFAAHSFYEARSAYESGRDACKDGQDDIARTLEMKIAGTKCAMAELNLHEAEHALRQGLADKAVEHLELAKTLTDDPKIREKADSLLAEMPEKHNDTVEMAPTSASCSSCSHGATDDHDVPPDMDTDLPLLEHYDLLIHQLPPEMYDRYSSLGENFACMFIAASRDNHQEALDLLEKWFDGSHRDIYCYEKGKILHRLGKINESETLLRRSISENSRNPLAHLGLALLLLEDNRLGEAAGQLEYMIANDLFAGQALMMRGEVYQLSGDTDAAIKLYGSLLETPLARAAAEKLHELLLECHRQPEAAHIFKRYLSKCQH
ncbi:MAG: tetratricopeptide repeat protein [Desulfuromonadales bacterium]|nr:tetratricopeptide repeat protein [Desulfuromonadales bacterium]